MVQSLQELLSFWPYLSFFILVAATLWAVWLISSLNKKEYLPQSNGRRKWYLKRSPEKLGKIQF